MRKLKLQVQISVDGFVAGPNGELDWLTWHKDDRHQKTILELHEHVDTILLGRKMTEGFVTHWENVVNNQPESSDFPFALKMVNTPRIIFTKTLNKPIGKNASLAKGNLADEIANLKNQSGKDIIVYGGAGFVSSLIQGGHIDEYNFFVNPTMLGKGMRIFEQLKHKQNLSLIGATSYGNGVAVLRYVRESIL